MRLPRHALLAAALVLATAPGAEARERRAAPAIPTVSERQLPPEARAALALIRKGGPFPNRRDGVVFQNRERRLPAERRGYYREYTVATPGARDRGARRLVAGRAGELYYSDDHYRSFRRVEER